MTHHLVMFKSNLIIQCLDNMLKHKTCLVKYHYICKFLADIVKDTAEIYCVRSNKQPSSHASEKVTLELDFLCCAAWLNLKQSASKFNLSQSIILQEGQRGPKRQVVQAAIRLATAVITFRNNERNVRSPS